ncbi:DUF6949 family protein [Roseibium aestuarii]|uniref:DUF6949 family protein n=1 Tax=Roseibium aestuarii TaxID=2600299 RepID=A0ABW4JZ71_9HYPH|nr:hypothetical protein [Roseibium aestuarii]
MLFELVLALYIGTAGFVAAGVLGSLYQLVTDRPPHFALDAQSVIGTICAVSLCIFAGPFIIMRNAIRGRRLEGRPIGWLVASSTIAGMWSLCSGVVVMHFALGIAHGL